MENTFSINYQDQEITIEQLPSDQHGNVYYIANLPTEKFRLEYTQDDEGAGHWMDERTNGETEVSIELGQLIEIHMMQHHKNV